MMQSLWRSTLAPRITSSFCRSEIGLVLFQTPLIERYPGLYICLCLSCICIGLTKPTTACSVSQNARERDDISHRLRSRVGHHAAYKQIVAQWVPAVSCSTWL
ncbi:hypothetical protein BDV33DRAFT_169132 [Aspergillus novoparasiticus]|uniref:Uncharacterized protein n=1 Tax=Aspergillus novoparasiticus TaxID=986946 RepID=A0A5N6EY07_9EURO|nr:hypothetical protein BDV33DRAFT_169132 [Aspergillus novoparasiticus]